MSQQQNSVLNGPTGELTMAFKEAQQLQGMQPKVPQTNQPPPSSPLTPQQSTENYPRPPLNRGDSRTGIYIRPGPPIQSFRPPPPGFQQQPRPQPPPGQQFLPRNPQGAPPRPNQPVFPQNPSGTRPLSNFATGPGVRPSTPFPRPPGAQQQQQVRSPGVLQHQRSVSQLVSSQQQPFLRGNTVDVVDHAENGLRNSNRMFSMSSASFDGHQSAEERRYSISSVDENKQIQSNESSRPASRADGYMNKIIEGQSSTNNNVQLKEEHAKLKMEGSPKIEGISPILAPSITRAENQNSKPITENKIPQSLTSANTVKEENNFVVSSEGKPLKQSSEQTAPSLIPDVKENKDSKINESVAGKPANEKCAEADAKSKEIKEETGQITKKTDGEKPTVMGRTATPDLKIPIKSKPAKKQEGDNDSGVDESTQGNDRSSNGDRNSPRKSSSGKTGRTSSTTPTKSRSSSRNLKSPGLKSPDSVSSDTSGTTEKKKVPMNKIQVGFAPSPNLKVVRSKIGSLENANHKPGGGNVKIENRKIEIKAQPRIAAKNECYTPGGGEKKIIQQKLQWNAKSKIGSLENASHKPKGGDKKIESIKLDFKDKAKPKIGSKDNLKHKPGGGDVKNEESKEANQDIENRKLDLKVESKIGSLDNVKHRPGGGDKKIFDDKEYLRQKSAMSNENNSISGSQNSLPSHTDPREPVSDENLNREH